MDHQFRTDLLGQPYAELSMGHESIGVWLSDEVATNTTLIRKVLSDITMLVERKMGSHQYEGREYSLYIDAESAYIAHNSIFKLDNDDLSENELALFDDEMQLNTGETRAECGLEDFKSLLIEWHHFVS